MDSRVFLSTKFNGKKTVCDELFFTSPYKLISPLYNETEAEFVLMSSSAGLLKGDTVEMRFEIGEWSDVKISSQSFEKVFNTQDGDAQKRVFIEVGENAFLKFMALPTIPFANSDYRNDVAVSLSPSSRFLYSDVFSCGRVFMGEQFSMKRFANRLHVSMENAPIFIDTVIIDPNLWNYGEIGLWQGHTHNGLLYVYGCDEVVDWAREMAPQFLKNCEVGSSLCKKGACVRVLGDSGERIHKFFNEIAKRISSDAKNEVEKG